MKVGKKALSLLLAMIMLMSSMSVSFSVFAATDTPADIYSAIVMHHDSLMDAIDKANAEEPDTSGVPVKNGSVWEVKRDTLNGGWLAVSRAIASYAKGKVATIKTYVDLVENIKADAQGYAESNGHSAKVYIQQKRSGSVKDYSFYDSLNNLETKLEESGFLRVYKSYLVNMDRIKTYQCKVLTLDNGIVLKVSERNYGEQKKKYLLWKGKQ